MPDSFFIYPGAGCIHGRGAAFWVPGHTLSANALKFYHFARGPVGRFRICSPSLTLYGEPATVRAAPFDLPCLPCHDWTSFVSSLLIALGSINFLPCGLPTATITINLVFSFRLKCFFANRAN
jgi:hypothetical protein